MDRSGQAYIGLIDCNNFFVSCERLFRPDLAHRPVVVLSSNDGCIVARSTEVKDKGIPMGVPYFQVKDKLAEWGTAVFSSNFTLYRDISQRVFSVVRSEVDSFEAYSIDEGFFTIPAQNAEVMARYLKDKVAQEVGMPVAIGLAHSKTLAKVAGDLAKAGSGIFLLSPEEWNSRASVVLLGALWGVGARRAASFRSVRLLTARDVMEAPTHFLRSVGGIEAERLQAELSGLVAYPVATAGVIQKSVTSSRSFGRPTASAAAVHDAAAFHVRQVATTLRRDGLCAGFITVYLHPSRRTASEYAAVRTTRFVVPTNHTVCLLREAARLTEALFKGAAEYSKVGVTVGECILASEVPVSLWQPPDIDGRWKSLLITVDGLTARWGEAAATIGGRGQATVWQSRSRYRSPSYTTRWNDLVVVQSK